MLWTFSLSNPKNPCEAKNVVLAPQGFPLGILPGVKTTFSTTGGLLLAILGLALFL